MTQLLAWLEDAVTWVACAALLVMGGIVTASVVGRVVFNAPVPDDLVMVGLLMVAVIVLPLAFIERTDGHIVVTVVADRLPVRVQYALRALGNVLMGIFFGTMGLMLARKIPSEYAENLYYDGRLEIQTWPMKAVFAVGIIVLVLRLLVSLARNLSIVASGRAPEPARAAPPHSVE